MTIASVGDLTNGSDPTPALALTSGSVDPAALTQDEDWAVVADGEVAAAIDELYGGTCEDVDTTPRPTPTPSGELRLEAAKAPAQAPAAEPLAPVAPSTTYAVRSPRPEPARRVVVPPIPDDPRPSGPARALRPEDMAPNRLYVPALGVYASLEPVAFGSGRLTVPDEPWRVGIDDGSAPLRSAVGTTLLAGHVDLSGTAGALVGLSRTPIGARIYVTDTRGGVHEFVAASLQQYSKVGLPRSIFAVDGPRQLALVTCGGPVISDGATRHYRDNVVVTAVPRR